MKDRRKHRCSSRIASLSQLKKNVHLLKNILWDVEPKQLMESSHKKTETGIVVKNPINGYVFYIETMDKKPGLFLMCHTPSCYGETMGKIDEIPEEMLLEAIQENKEKEFFRMYPINNKIKRWLMKQFGMEG
jgi:hypothetical protein